MDVDCNYIFIKHYSIIDFIPYEITTNLMNYVVAMGCYLDVDHSNAIHCISWTAWRHEKVYF